MREVVVTPVLSFLEILSSSSKFRIVKVSHWLLDFFLIKIYHALFLIKTHNRKVGHLPNSSVSISKWLFAVENKLKSSSEDNWAQRLIRVFQRFLNYLNQRDLMAPWVWAAYLGKGHHKRMTKILPGTRLTEGKCSRSGRGRVWGLFVVGGGVVVRWGGVQRVIIRIFYG
jgi:hypothetical protein